MEEMTFELELAALINKYNVDVDLGIPDYVLADAALRSILTFSDLFDATCAHFGEYEETESFDENPLDDPRNEPEEVIDLT